MLSHLAIVRRSQGVAQLLCDRLGYRYFDKNLMLGLTVATGLAPEKVVDLSDEKHRARSLIECLVSKPAMLG